MKKDSVMKDMLETNVNYFSFQEFNLEDGKPNINILIQGKDNSQNQNEVIFQAIIHLLEAINYDEIINEDVYATQKIILPILNTLGISISNFQPWLFLNSNKSKYLTVVQDYLKTSIDNNHAEIDELSHFFEEEL